MNKFTTKFLWIIGSAVVGFLAIWPPSEKLKTGIDLSGGTILVYEVKQEANSAAVDMDELIQALKRRINPEGVLDIPIRRLGPNRLEIILPKASAEEVEEVKKKMTNQGSLEFRILATRHGKREGSDALRAIDRALAKDGLINPPPKLKWWRLGETISGSAPVVGGDRKSITDPNKRWAKNAMTGRMLTVVGKTAAGTDQTFNTKIESSNEGTLKFDKPLPFETATSYRIDYNPSEIVDADPSRPESPIIREETIAPGHTVKYILCEVDRNDVTGQYLSRVFPTQDEQFRPAVGFRFNRVGARKFGTLTGTHLPEDDGFKYRLAIVLDGVIQSAPTLNAKITDSGIIQFGSTGNTAEEVNTLIAILQSGKLPATLNPEPLQEESIGPTLGEDTIAKGLRAIYVSMFVVPVFMLVYYRFAGLVAIVALLLNMLLLVGSMAIIKASFTLPGLAGLALTIGMAVDANVLIFERMREEQERGAGLAQQIRNGFSRAWVTIFDANVTTILSGFVLYFVGTDEVKGFALTLIIGLIWNLFTAVYVSRVIFDFWLHKGWLKPIKMLRFMNKTNIDFISVRKACMLGSAIVVAAGIGAVVLRGQTMFNIDFTGGTLVTIRLNESASEVQQLSPSQRAGFVRQRASALPDVTVESLSVGGSQAGARYNIRTTIQNRDQVRDQLVAAFGDALQRVNMSVGEPKPIAAAPAAAPADAAKKDATSVPTTDPANRFAGGRSYELAFNLPQSATAIASLFRNSLSEAGIANPDLRFEVVNPLAVEGTTTVRDSTTLTLQTNLEPDVAKVQLAKLAELAKQNTNLMFERSETFGSTVAGETQTKAIVATIASWVIIAAYLWFRFKSITFGLAAIIAVIHDVLITLGAVAATYWIAQIPVVGPALLLDQFKIDLSMIAAFLTLIGFSVNDTIVIFDRIREIRGKSTNLTAQMINDAVNQTLSRTILTSLTAWLVVIILYIFGGEGLHGFAFCLVVGFLSGTYSTIYIASPILIDWMGGKPAPATTSGGKKTAAQAA
ncbi:MAG: protein translocase subunit SecD [Isosphaeraceae bacterium]|nr:protein translocase subunit SecD [Isosphaeraceae bacterium]